MIARFLLATTGDKVTDDHALNFTARLLQVIDSELDQIDAAMVGDDSNVAEDSARQKDMATGLGFVVCQQYINRICQIFISLRGCNKGDLLKKGPQNGESGLSVAEAIFGIADSWKHEGEELTNPRTVKAITSLGTGSDALRKLEGTPSRFEQVLKLLTAWRDECFRDCPQP